MATLNQDARILGKDMRVDDDDQRAGPAQPVSQSEIDDLLYNEEISASERVARLRQYRDDLSTQEGGDVGDDDLRNVIGEIDLALSRLEGGGSSGIIEAPLDIDPLDHRETLSPDDDLREELEAEDADSEADLFGLDDTDDGDIEWSDQEDEKATYH